MEVCRAQQWQTIRECSLFHPVFRKIISALRSLAKAYRAKRLQSIDILLERITKELNKGLRAIYFPISYNIPL
jgi:tRNA/tmRNA/rRNA uracil-C5-methylase (TrmA/RlmC/RlmD family)